MTFRFAKEEDCTLILRFIRGLADYEKMSDQVVATEELLREWIFEKKKAEVLFICVDDKECLYFRSIETKDMARRFLKNSHRLRLAGAAADWNGHVLTGISRV